MYRITPTLQNYHWGSTDTIVDFLRQPAPGGPVAEAWFGAHSDGPALVEGQGDLQELLRKHPELLGSDVQERFDGELPFLLKLIAPNKPLSLQVHPTIKQAIRGSRMQRLRGSRRQERSYTDPNHKPEMLYALTEFHALCGFRASRRVRELLRDLKHPLVRAMNRRLNLRPPSSGMHSAFSYLLNNATAGAVAAVVDECRERLNRGNSPSWRTDQTVVRLAEVYPGDPGVVAALLLNPVRLTPGQALFVPAGCVHAYLSGFGVEIMANSNNVLRAGLTSKPIDRKELLRIVDPVAAPPIRIGPEEISPGVDTFYAPVDDFELSVATATGESVTLPGRGPRIILCLEGKLQARSNHGSATLARGEAVFVPARDRFLELAGTGRAVQAGVP